VSGVWTRLRPALPLYAVYASLTVIAGRFQDVDLLPMVLLLLAGAALGGAVWRYGK
jgi:hypothetical protein